MTLRGLREVISMKSLEEKKWVLVNMVTLMNSGFSNSVFCLGFFPRFIFLLEVTVNMY